MKKVKKHSVEKNEAQLAIVPYKTEREVLT